ncbi:hypothetical protein D9M69_544640 [compost metagenome]
MLRPVIGPVAIGRQAVDVELEPGLFGRLLQQHGDVHRTGRGRRAHQRHSDAFHAGLFEQELGFFRIVGTLWQVGVKEARTGCDRVIVADPGVTTEYRRLDLLPIQ